MSLQHVEQQVFEICQNENYLPYYMVDYFMFWSELNSCLIHFMFLE